MSDEISFATVLPAHKVGEMAESGNKKRRRLSFFLNFSDQKTFHIILPVPEL